MLHGSTKSTGKPAQGSLSGFSGTPTSVDLRADRRFNIDVAGVLQVVGAVGAVYVVTVRDISKSGLRVSCPVSLSDGLRVEVSCCDTSIYGEVRYSRAVGADDFYVGIKGESGIDLAPFLEPIMLAN